MNPVTYVETNGTLPSGTAYTSAHYLNVADPTSVAWNAFNPETSLSAIGSSATPDFTKITGIGVWFENKRASNSTSGLTFSLTEIQFNAIPEPSGAAVLGLAAALLLLQRRRETT